MYSVSDTTELADELVDVIDASGRVLRCASRREVRRNNLLHRAVSVLCHDRSRRVYVHRRSPTKDVFPGMYDMFVSGMVRTGETSMQAARRELAEELGVDGAGIRWLFDHLYIGREDRCLIAVHDVEWEGPVHLQASEISSGAFLKGAELRALMANSPFVPDSLEIFPRSLELLG
jgi:8-oxo-dGTP pyrophosphatase MutT (NUDIX family)